MSPPRPWLCALLLVACGTTPPPEMDAGDRDGGPGMDAACFALCRTPPPSDCVDERTLRSYAEQGVCTADGGCHYAASERECAGGCEGGACRPCAPGTWVVRPALAGASLAVAVDAEEVLHLVYVRDGWVRYASGPSPSELTEEMIAPGEVAFRPAIDAVARDARAVAWVDASTRRVRFAEPGPAGWSVETITLGASSVSAPALRLDPRGSPAVAWVDEGSATISVVSRDTDWLLGTVDGPGPIRAAVALFQERAGALAVLFESSGTLFAKGVYDFGARVPVAAPADVESLGVIEGAGARELTTAYFGQRDGTMRAFEHTGISSWDAGGSDLAGLRGRFPHLFEGDIGGVGFVGVHAVYWGAGAGSGIDARLETLDPMFGRRTELSTIAAEATETRPFGAVLGGEVFVLFEQGGEILFASRPCG